ncbi:hypothetical protein KUV35_19115 [Marinobacter salsuginis]|uniref:hypothetical protein n=1 Tax=Marinobacter salsuginis TaxID=418719 RepID=UPI001C97ACD0|nr:hypothetical protein [Marinobacter salsuginis]MBY6073419.1 hypothetical protein [Marinobacter salsuginis]
MASKESYKPLKTMIKEEQKNLLTGFVAFSVAILILVIQGSLAPSSTWGTFGVCLLAASIPVGIIAYLLHIKVLSADIVPDIGHQKSEDCSSLAMSLTVLGFLFILWESSTLLAIVLAASVALSLMYFARAMRAWDSAVSSLEDEKKVEDQS